MIEAGVIIGLDGNPLHWHQPAGATIGSLPDSEVLWNVFWDNRKNLSGFAHSHPGGGVPSPSHCDVTTFSAVERALGKRLKWWITSSECVALYEWAGTDKYYYTSSIPTEPLWVPELRRRSNYYLNYSQG